MKNIIFFLSAAFCGLFLIGPSFSQYKINDNGFDSFYYRNMGAFRISAWVGDIAVPENPAGEHKYTFYVASRNGGVWKTINNGTTFFCITDDLGVTAIGDIEIAPSDANILWVGTGEDFNCRSSYYGNGVWKSYDAGGNMGKYGIKRFSSYFQNNNSSKEP